MGISHELARRLKDAGFPQKENGPGLLPEDKHVFLAHSDIWPKLKEIEPGAISTLEAKELIVYAPTLSELIETCGSIDFALKSRNDTTINGTREWFAGIMRDDKSTQQHFGATPEEAVANLWLALNEKSTNIKSES